MKGFSEEKKLVSCDWLQAFRIHHPKLSVRKPENLSARRAMHLNEVAVKKHFDSLFKILADNDLLGHPERIWNADEIGLQDVFE